MSSTSTSLTRASTSSFIGICSGRPVRTVAHMQCQAVHRISSKQRVARDCRGEGYVLPRSAPEHVCERTNGPPLVEAGSSPSCRSSINDYARFDSVAGPSLIVIFPLRPVGKNPPCREFGCIPKARYKTCPAVLVAAKPLLRLIERYWVPFPLGGGMRSAPSTAEEGIFNFATCV
jgi:hypothetical protein